MSGVEVSFNENMKLNTTKDLFLSNNKNKETFIHMLGKHLVTAGCKVLYHDGDADLEICFQCIDSAKVKPVALIGDGTDLLVLLLYHAKETVHDIIFMPRKSSPKKVNLSVKSILKSLQTDLTENLLFIHALTGCDTTSRLQGIGKGTALKRLSSSSELCKLGQKFMQSSADPTEIIKAGEKAIMILYHVKGNNTLDSMRYTKFLDLVSTKLNQVEPSSLPPTSSSAKYHSMRVYLQVQQWKDPKCSLKPEHWGWRKSKGVYIPIASDLEPAPKDLLKVFWCNCQGDCNSRMCTCRKYSRECSVACGNCWE